MTCISSLRLSNYIIFYKKVHAYEFFHIRNSYMAIWQRERAASKAKNVIWEVTLTGAPLLSLWCCIKMEAEGKMD